MTTESRPKDAVIERVRKLLEMQSGRGCTEAEAATAMKMASRIMAEHALSMAEIEDTAESEDWVTEPAGSDSGKYILMEWKAASGICQDFFFVKCVYLPKIIHDNTWGYITHFFGKPTNVETARFVYQCLLRSAVDLWASYRLRTGAPGSDRRAFVVGMFAGFREKLRQERRVMEAERDLLAGSDGQPAGVSTGTTLATIADKTKLAFEKAHPNLKKGSSYTNPSGGDDAFREGHRAGRKLNFNKPIGTPQAGGSKKLPG